MNPGIRIYGQKPFKIAVLHGGPGAPGYMAPVARELSNIGGVIEPLQSQKTIDGQIEELKNQLDKYADTPVTLIGSSWGAILALFLASRYPKLVSGIILIGSAVFDASSSASMQDIRLSRLNQSDRKRYEEIQSQLTDSDKETQDKLMAEWGKMLDKTDMYDPITTDLEVIEVQSDVFSSVWPEYAALRDKPGYLKNEISKINVPVDVIHGEYDPHPIDGIRPYLESWLRSVKFHILPKCGHYPWIEKHAKDKFYNLLKDILA